MATEAAPRPRRARALQVDTPARPVSNGAAEATKVTPEMVKMAQDVMIANAAKNKATREEDARKKELNKAMIAAGVEQFPFTVELEGAFQSCESVIASGSSEYIDVGILKGLVDDATFMKIVKATKGDTEKLAGQNIAIKATRSKETPAALSVRKIKS